MTSGSRTVAEMRERFERAQAWGWAPLYTRLMDAAAASDDLAALACTIGRGQAQPNLLFAAVHYLLLGGAQHELREWYPDLVDVARPVDTVGPAFEEFC